MGYFEHEKSNKTIYSNVSKVEELLNELANICFEELMLSSDAYVCMIKLNMHGYKRLHRYLSKEFYDMYLEIQNKYVEMYNKSLNIPNKFEEYTAKDIPVIIPIPRELANNILFIFTTLFILSLPSFLTTTNGKTIITITKIHTILVATQIFSILFAANTNKTNTTSNRNTLYCSFIF